MKLELAVSSDHVRVYVGRGGQAPSPAPLVTLGMELYPPSGSVLVIEMTPGQTDYLIEMLKAARTRPEGT